MDNFKFNVGKKNDEMSEADMRKLFLSEPDLVYVSEYVYPNGSVFRGQMREEDRHGFGIQIWPDGAKYVGYWSQNQAQGKGTFWHAEGDVYEGEFKDDKANGYGVYTHVNGSRYEG